MVPLRLWDILDEIAEDALLVDDFKLLDRSLLRLVLQRDTLRIKEAAVYERLKAWAEHQVLKRYASCHAISIVLKL